MHDAHIPRSDISRSPVRPFRQAQGPEALEGQAHGPSIFLGVLRSGVSLSNPEVLEGKKSFMQSTSPAEEWFAPCNAKLTVSEVTEQPSIRLKLLQHVLHGRAYLSVFVGSGYTIEFTLQMTSGISSVRGVLHLTLVQFV